MLILIGRGLQFWFLSLGFCGLGGFVFFRFVGLFESLDDGLFFSDDAAVFRFPNSQEDERNRGCGHVELSFAGNFRFRFPAEKL